MITDSRGKALWETRVPIRVLTLGNQTKVQLVLRPVERPKPPPEPTSLAVLCNELRFHVNLSPASATLVLPDSKVTLPSTETSSGKRFSDGSMTLAVSGSAAYFQRPGKTYRNCTVAPEPEAKPRP
jgi:membrane-bound inhibitor of C-type lysozyme